MNKILIVSNVKNHYNFVNVLLRIFEDEDVTLLTTQEVIEQIHENKIENPIKKIIKQKKEVYKSINSMLLRDKTLIIFDEAYQINELFSLLITRNQKNNIFYTIHNCQRFFKPKLNFPIKNFVKSLLRFFLVLKIKNIIVVGSNIRDILSSKYKSKNFVFIPFTYKKISSLSKVSNKSSKVTITIPGTISRARNYLDFLKTCDNNSIFSFMKLYLLGQPIDEYGENVVKYVDILNKKGADIKYFKEYVSNETFENVLSETDVLLSPFNVKFRTNDGHIEIYGQTKETGISFLLLSCGIPGILPIEFNVMQEIKSQVIFYQDITDLPNIIVRLSSSEIELQQLKENGIQNNSNINFIDLKNKLYNVINLI